jgi:Gas vesicle synthesis protein GvpO
MADRRRTRDVADDEEPELLAEDVSDTEEESPETADEESPDAADADGDRSAGRPRRRPARTDGRPARTEGRPARSEGRPARTDRRPARRARSDLTARESAEAALRQVAELTSKQVEGVTGVERTEDGWLVGIEVVEDRRIPSSADILASYEAAIDPDGELMSYRRIRRYPRGRSDEDGNRR